MAGHNPIWNSLESCATVSLMNYDQEFFRLIKGLRISFLYQLGFSTVTEYSNYFYTLILGN